jgi:hypothetical protein
MGGVSPASTLSRRLQGRPGRLAALVGLVLLGACGGRGYEEEQLRRIEERLAALPRTESFEARMETIRDLVELVARNPEVGVPRLVRALKEERARPDDSAFRVRFDLEGVPPEQQPMFLVRQQRILGARLAAAGYQATTQPDEDDRATFVTLRRPRDAQGVPAPDAVERGYVAGAMASATIPGHVALMFVVEEPGAEEARGALWPGDAASHRAFLAEESKRLAESVSAGRPYEPGRPPFRVARTRPRSDGGPAPDVLLTESEHPALRLRRDAIESVGVGVDPRSGMRVLSLTLRRQREEDFATLLRAHAGAPLALVVDGLLEQVATVGAEAGREVRFPLGPASSASSAEWARYLVTATAGGAYEAPVTAEAVPTAPENPDTPVALVLAEVGAPVVPALRALHQEDPGYKDRVSWILSEIEKRAAGTRRMVPDPLGPR